MPTAATHYTRREEEILGHYTKRGMLRYKVETAGLCRSCRATINVKCPKCGLLSEDRHGEITFREIEGTYERWDGYTWVQIECPKCDYVFKVILR